MKNDFLSPLKNAISSFVLEPGAVTKKGPHIRDGVDLKRWMMLVVFALVPCIIMAVWNSGVQSFIYGSGDLSLVTQFETASLSFRTYFAFCGKYGWEILGLGCFAFFPIMLISYIVGGFWEFLFAAIRRHEISEGFLVTGILYALILPSTIPYWMAAIGISVGVVLGKEIFGGTGMNILNPALVARCFLFFSFPQNMTGEMWVGTNPTHISSSVENMDGVTQQSMLNLYNIPPEIKRAHVDAIGLHMGARVKSKKYLQPYLQKWGNKSFIRLSYAELESFVTESLGLSPELFQNAYSFAKLKFGQGMFNDANFFFGNMIGSMGETSKLACLLGALLLLLVGIASWRIMVAMALGALLAAGLFELCSTFIGANGGIWNPAKFDMPMHKHLLLGSFAFGLVFMATEPVTAPKQNFAKWWYGILIGALAIIIRVINPAFPEGVMLAILFGNVFSALFDHYAVKRYRNIRYKHARKAL
jgi:Na+-transporting NADH:ubiquinone oxidoreductase subunit B